MPPPSKVKMSFLDHSDVVTIWAGVVTAGAIDRADCGGSVSGVVDALGGSAMETRGAVTRRRRGFGDRKAETLLGSNGGA